MAANVNQVCPKNPVSKSKLSAALGAAWGRVANSIGRGTLADKAGMDEQTVKRAVSGPSLPAAEHLLNSLVADPTALQEVLALYGVKAVPLVAEPANDMSLATALAQSVAEYLSRLADGKRCHIDTGVLANLFRPLIPQMQAIVDEADRAKGIAA